VRGNVARRGAHADHARALAQQAGHFGAGLDPRAAALGRARVGAREPRGVDVAFARRVQRAHEAFGDARLELAQLVRVEPGAARGLERARVAAQRVGLRLGRDPQHAGAHELGVDPRERAQLAGVGLEQPE
jgi:hypothetical protein